MREFPHSSKELSEQRGANQDGVEVVGDGASEMMHMEDLESNQDLETAVSMPGVAAVLDSIDPSDFQNLNDLRRAVALAGQELEPLLAQRTEIQEIRLGILDKLAILMFHSGMPYGEVTRTLGCHDTDPEAWSEDKVESLMFSSDALHVISDFVSERPAHASEAIYLALTVLVKTRGSAGATRRILEDADVANQLGSDTAKLAVDHALEAEFQRQRRIAEVAAGTIAVTAIADDDTIMTREEADLVFASHRAS